MIELEVWEQGDKYVTWGVNPRFIVAIAPDGEDHTMAYINGLTHFLRVRKPYLDFLLILEATNRHAR